jgi:hypothetical protein
VKRDIETRLRKLEADHLPTSIKRNHCLIGETTDDCEAQRRGMIESGRAEGSDNFTFILLVGVRPDVEQHCFTSQQA